MSSGKKTITIRQFLEAMELDNVPLARGKWFNERNGITEEACILGQCAINLGVTSSAIQTLVDIAIPGLAGAIINWNDAGTNYDTMVQTVKEKLQGREDVAYDYATTMFYFSKLKETH